MALEWINAKAKGVEGFFTGIFHREEVQEADLKTIVHETKFTQKEVEQFHENFQKGNHKGYLTEDEFVAAYCSHAPTSTNRSAAGSSLVAKQMFRSLDKSGDGKIDFKEFMCALSLSTHGSLEEKLRWLFAVYDINHDEKLSLDEVSTIVRSMQTLIPRQERMNDREIRDMFEKCDADNDGVLTIDEFVKVASVSPRFTKLVTEHMQPAQNE